MAPPAISVEFNGDEKADNCDSESSGSHGEGQNIFDKWRGLQFSGVIPFVFRIVPFRN